MGTYYRRPDGLAVVTHDDGWTSPPLAIDELELEDAGHTPAPKPGLPAGALANNAHAPRPESRLDAGGGLGAPAAPADDAALADWAADQQLRSAVAKATPKAPPGTHSAPAPTVPQRGPALAMQNFEGAQPVEQETPGRVDPKRLRRVGTGQPSAMGEQPEAAPRPTLVKGGMRLQSATRQPGVEISDDAKRDLMTDDRPEQLERTAAGIAEQRRELSLQRESMALDEQRSIDEQVVQRQAIDRELAKKSQAIAKRDAEIDRMKPQSVREYWDDRGSFARLGAIFQAAVGGYLQGMTGASRNSGLDWINDLVSSDLARQQDDYERAVGRRDDARNDYAQAIELYGTPEAAALDFKMRRLAAAEKLLMARAEDVGTQEYKQQAAALATQMRQERGRHRMELEQLEKGRFLQENWLNVPDQYVGGAPKPKENEVHQLSADMEKAGQGELDEQIGELEDLAAELPEDGAPTIETRNVLSRGVRTGLDYVGGSGTASELLDTDHERRMKAKVSRFKGKMRLALSGQAVSESEKEDFNRQVEGVNDRAGAEALLSDLRRRGERRKAGIRAGAAPEAVQEYERRKRAYSLPERPRSQRVDDQ